MTDKSGTTDLIERLVADAEPVHRLPSPLRRCLSWFAVASLAGLGIVLLGGDEATWSNAAASWSSSVQIGASLLTALAAGLAAFQLSVPGHAKAWALLPLPPLLLWVAALGLGCFEDWLIMSWRALAFEISSRCIWLMALIGLPLAASVILCLKRAAPLDAPKEGFLAGLAAAAVASTVVQLLYPLERDFLVLLWNFGSVLTLAASGWLFGSQLFRSHRARTFDQ